MKIASSLTAAVVLTLLTAITPVARAEEAPPVGLSFDAYAAPMIDRSVTNQQTGEANRSRGALGVAALLNFGEYVVGGVVDGMTRPFGDGRLAMGGIVGWQPRLGTQRYQVLGELGRERFKDIAPGPFSSSTPEAWLDYVGARLGMSETFSANGHFEVGAWLFVRKHLGEATVTQVDTGWFGGEEFRTPYTVGGYSAGVAFRVGMRFDRRQPLPVRGPTGEVGYQPAKI